MQSNVPRVKLGEVLTHRGDFITVNDLQLYRRVTAQLHAKGIILRDEIDGSLIKTKKQRVCRAGDFLVAEIDAKLGGFGIVPPYLEGSIVSSHYFLFEIDETKLEREYLDFFIRTEEFQKQITARGSTNYAAIRPPDVLQLEIPLPSVKEQRRIVATLERLFNDVNAARKERAASIKELETLQSQIKNTAFPKPHTTTVGEFVRFQTGYAFKSEWFSEEGIRLVRNANIGHGNIDWSDTMRIPESLRKQFGNFELRMGDILVSLDRPIISTGVKVAKVSEADLPSLLLQRVARAQFDENKVDVNYFFHWLTSPNFITAINPGRSSGVPHISHKEIERIPFSLPPFKEQRRIVARLDRLQDKVDEVKRLQAETEREMVALVPAVLAKAFGN